MTTITVLLARVRAAAHSGIGAFGAGTFGSGSFGAGATGATVEAQARPLVLVAGSRPLVVLAVAP